MMTVKAQAPINLYAAGSLKAAFFEIAQSYEGTYNIPVALTFGSSGLLRQRIEQGERADVYASANMRHPEQLEAQGRSGPTVCFAHNRLCALVQAEVETTPDNLLECLLDPKIRLGTSTPVCDPSGDYAWQLFAKADKISPGARAILENKAFQLTGGPESPRAPEGQNLYGWVMSGDKADIFLTYCTNAELALKQVSSLRIVQIPEALKVAADYGLTVLDRGNPAAWQLAFYILSPEGQRVLARYGFETIIRNT